MNDDGFLESLTESEKDVIIHELDKSSTYYKQYNTQSSAASMISMIFRFFL